MQFYRKRTRVDAHVKAHEACSVVKRLTDVPLVSWNHTKIISTVIKREADYGDIGSIRNQHFCACNGNIAQRVNGHCFGIDTKARVVHHGWSISGESSSSAIILFSRHFWCPQPAGWICRLFTIRCDTIQHDTTRHQAAFISTTTRRWQWWMPTSCFSSSCWQTTSVNMHHNFSSGNDISCARVTWRILCILKDNP